MANEPLRGGCLCGAVRYEVTAEPVSAATCHCRMCQRQSGSAFMGFFSVPRSGLRLSGELREYRASPLAVRGFCPVCGSSISMAYEHEADTIGLTMGSLDDPALVAPIRHWGVESWVPWLEVSDALPRERTDEDRICRSPPPLGDGSAVTDAKRERERQEALRSLEEMRHSGEVVGTSQVARQAGRARRHFAAEDADAGDWAELWGRRIGRALSLAAVIALVIYLVATYL